MEEVVVGEEVLKTAKVKAAKAITGLKPVEGSSEAEASGVPEEVVLQVATNISF